MAESRARKKIQEIYSLMKEDGFKKLFVSRKNHRIRIVFAKEHLNKDFIFCNTVPFTDENKFNLCGPKGRGYIWRKSGKGLKEQNLKAKVWMCMSSAGNDMLNTYFYVIFINPKVVKYNTTQNSLLLTSPYILSNQQR
ncbi:uncharacterized protein [Euwallacea fornicatus]|uniref:uncharacterized protein n=1 Tax=Euwallacea fornicatus TaxID=995702 RepID=UPI00338E0F4C